MHRHPNSERTKPRAAALCILVALLWPLASVALDPDSPLAEFTLKTWGREDGLPHGLVIDLEQSSDGYVWAATWQGAARFNGREFVNFDQQRLPWIPDGAAWSLTNAADGSLLLASQRYGLSRRRDGQWTPEPGLEGELSRLFAVAEDAAGILWMATERGLLSRVDGRLKRYGVKDGLPDSAVLSLSTAANGEMWVGTANGAARVDGEVITAFGPEQGLPPGEIGMVLSARDGSIRVGSKQGAYRFDGEHFVRDPAGLPQDEVSALLVDSRGTLWVGTIGNGIFRASARGLEQLDTGQGLPSNHVNALLEDSQGNIWIATHGGLAQLRETRFAQYSRGDGLADDFARAVVEDAAGVLWVATNSGVSRIVDGRIEPLGPQYPDASLSTLSLLARNNGEIWFGTYNQGIRVFTPKGMRSIGRDDGLVGDEIRAMLDSSDGAVWVGTASGLTRLGNDGPRSWTQLDGSSRTIYVRALLQASDGRVWIGMQQGLAWSDGKQVVLLDGFAADPVNVFGLHECEHGALWVVGAGGIRRLKGGKLDRLDARHQMDSAAIFGMLSDGHGTDWLSTADGLVGIDHAALERAMDGDPGALPMTRYGDGPGSESLALNGGSNPAIQRSRDGRIWLATSQGVEVFHPDALERPVAPPPTVIERIQVDGVDREPGAPMELQAGSRRIDFDYAGLSYLAPESLRYRHRLDGFDDDWVDAGAATTVSYTNLVPGDYRFEVEALVERASGPPRRAAQAFKLQAELYQTAAFRAAAVVLALLASVLLYSYRVAGLRRQALNLQSQVEQRTSELQTRGESLERADREKAALIERLRDQTLLLERHAREDELTGLANRRRLDAAMPETVAQCRAQGRPLAVALIDIDHFKQINDNLGHAVGDDVLRRIGERIRTHAHAPIVAGRYGGEEFAIILPGFTLEDARTWCETLRVSMVKEPFDVLPPNHALTISIGIIADDGGNPADLYATADLQLYAAKHSGRNRVCG